MNNFLLFHAANNRGMVTTMQATQKVKVKAVVDINGALVPSTVDRYTSNHQLTADDGGITLEQQPKHSQILFD